MRSMLENKQNFISSSEISSVVGKHTIEGVDVAPRGPEGIRVSQKEVNVDKELHLIVSSSA